jgi:hypothetical protein
MDEVNHELAKVCLRDSTATGFIIQAKDTQVFILSRP